MARKQLQNMQLPESGYNPIVFQGYTTEGPEFDMPLLANQIRNLDQTIVESSEKQGAVNLALANIRNELNEGDYAWFDEYANQQYIKPIQDEIDKGNFGSAITLANRLGTEAPGNFEFQDRIKVNKQYKNWQDEIKAKRDKGLIDETTYARALATNDYVYNPIYDSYGKNVGASDWKATFDPKNDISLKQIYEDLAKFKGVNQETRASKGGTKQEFYKGSSGQNLALKETKTGGSKAETTSEIDAEEWAVAFDNYLKANPEIELQLKQKYDNAKWLEEQALLKSQDESLSAEDRVKALDDYQRYKNNITDEQGGYLNSDEYIRKIAQPMFDVMAFRKHSLSTEAGDTLVDQKSLQQKNIANALFGGNLMSADLYSQGYSIEFINSNANKKAELLRQNKAMRNELSDDVL